MTLAFVPAWAWLPIYALAAYRLTRLWTRDSLPPLPRFRHYVRERWDGRAVVDLVDCPWCVGFWIAVGVVVVSASPLAGAWQWVALPLALSAVTGLLAMRDHDDEE